MPFLNDKIAHTHMHARTVRVHTYCRHTQAVKATPRSRNNWISVRGIKIPLSQCGIYQLSDTKGSLIYIPDRPDVSPICFKTYICVK